MTAKSNCEDDLYKQQLWNPYKNVVQQVEHKTNKQHIN